MRGLWRILNGRGDINADWRGDSRVFISQRVDRGALRRAVIRGGVQLLCRLYLSVMLR